MLGSLISFILELSDYCVCSAHRHARRHSSISIAQLFLAQVHLVLSLRELDAEDELVGACNLLPGRRRLMESLLAWILRVESLLILLTTWPESLCLHLPCGSLLLA